MAEDNRKDAFDSLFDVGRVWLEQLTTAQQAALDSCRQFTEGEAAGHSLRKYHEQWMNKVLDALDPFFVLEQATRQRVLETQAALFDVCDGTLRGFARSRSR
ncbi:MAG: hypothetical protein ABW123_15265 [Cystobacter sp.]